MSDIPVFPAGALEAIHAQSRAEFPSECCGYLLGSGPEAKLVPCINRQDRLHELDPEAHPRTSANAYNIGGRQLLDLVRSFEGEQAAVASEQMQNLYKMFMDVDATQVEINPMATTPDGEVICVDAKINFDDNAFFRQKEVFATI